MELHYGIICTRKIPGMPGTSPEPPGVLGISWARPWDPRGRPWDPRARSWDPWARPWDPWARPWDPRGRPWDPWARPWEPRGTSLSAPGHAPGKPQGRPYDPQGVLWTTKPVIPQQIYSARRSRMLCSNLLVATHRLNDSPGPFCQKKAAKIKKIHCLSRDFPEACTTKARSMRRAYV